MTNIARRQQLMIYLADAVDKKVNALYTLLEEDLKESKFSLSNAQLDILAQRRADFLSGKSEPKAWKEVHNRVRNKRTSA